ncbi:FHA domain-containing protein [Pseudomonas putida]|uniref:FHA domain-containing protein n=1 Tax=Pseudomonas putida TaxID=303 RepID=A0A6I6Y0N8_PSEPU|nr:FHA domain-containing protein [Pseudomonas putida]QHG65087.1 FHA domain-containing protein [Pseudomonas putida]
MSTLTLHVSNIEQLPHGVSRQHRFGRSGGTLGSQGADWLLIDRSLKVQPIHCEIRWTDGGYCAIDRSGHTYLNDGTRCLGIRPPMRLKDGDILRVGAYRLRVDLQTEQAIRRSLEEVFVPRQDVHEALEASASTRPRDNAINPLPHLTATDVCSAFDPLPGHDPLAALDARSQPCPAKQNPLQDLITGP